VLALGAAALLAFSGIGGARRSLDPARLWRDLGLVLKRPAPWVLSLAFGLFCGPFSAVSAWLPTLLIEMQARGTATAGAMAALIAIVYAPGSVLGGWLVGRGVPRCLVIGTGLGSMALGGLAAFGLGLWPAASCAAVILFSIAAGLIPTAILVAAPAMGPSLAQVGAFNGILIHGASVGTLVGLPALAAVVSSLGGWPAGGVYLASVCVAGPVRCARRSGDDAPSPRSIRYRHRPARCCAPFELP